MSVGCPSNEPEDERDVLSILKSPHYNPSGDVPVNPCDTGNQSPKLSSV
jgi:hypothetical protein